MRRALTSLPLSAISGAPSLNRLFCAHRTLLRNLGGLFLPPEANLSLDSSKGVLARAVVHAVSAPIGHMEARPRE